MLATGLAAALPVIVSTIRGLAAGWTPEGDRAVIATRAYDVLTSLTPLVGAWSSASTSVDHDIYYAGPLLYWLLAVPARLPLEAAFPIVMGAVNVAAIMGAVALARRRGGRALMFATGAAVALMCASLNTEVLHDIWASTAPVVLLVLLIFLGWSLACGEYRMLPLAVLTASFTMQCNLVFLLPSLAVLGVGLTGLLAWRLWGRDAAGSDTGSLRRYALAALAVAAVCWSAPLGDQALAWAGSSRGYGNLENLVDAARSRETPAGRTAGAYAVVRAIGVPPWWLRAPSDAAERTYEIFARPAATAILTSVLVLLALVVVTILGLRRGRRDVAAAGILALALCASLAAVTASFPNTPSTIFSYSYTSLFASPVGLWTWLVVIWSSLTLWPGMRERTSRRTSMLSATPLIGVAAVGALVAAGQGPIRQGEVFDATRTAVERLDTALPDPGTVRVESTQLELEAAVIHALRRRGATVRVDEDFSVQFGRAYARREPRYDHIVEIRPGDAPPEAGRRVARVQVGSSPRRTTSVWLRPGG